MSVVQCEQVHADERGRVTRITYDGRTSYSAAGRCVEWDGREYHVAVSEPDDHPAIVRRYPSVEAARDAIDRWEPRWPRHARDHARALQ